ncbi:unnamed protein product [Cylicocyclus nassatus]|uniref:Uncharacterized protein n=1 Tax=Cylicocyclus nassatus TaxID=53992 RepID=A0AA36GHZ8_CYLNA|nr:unnamed protein product [Cylicocyclus nassatus]
MVKENSDEEGSDAVAWLHINPGSIQNNFVAYQDSFTSYIRAGSRYIEFHGLENDNTSCCHIRIKNISDKVGVFPFRP